MKKEKADKAIHDTGSLAIDVLLTQVKAVAVQPVAVGILRATAHSAKQSSGERFQTFAAKVRGLQLCTPLPARGRTGPGMRTCPKLRRC